jgi:hypothetical protein
MGTSMKGQLLVKVGPGRLVLAWDNVLRDEVLDALEILTEWVTSRTRNYYLLRSGTRTGRTVIVKSIRPLPADVWEKGVETKD